MADLVFGEEAWDEYCYWQSQDKKTLKNINMLLKDIKRDAYTGIGKPEPLKHKLSGYWSREINATNRIVYKISNGQIEVFQCKGHYGN